MENLPRAKGALVLPDHPGGSFYSGGNQEVPDPECVGGNKKEGTCVEGLGNRTPPGIPALRRTGPPARGLRPVGRRPAQEQTRSLPPPRHHLEPPPRASYLPAARAEGCTARPSPSVKGTPAVTSSGEGLSSITSGDRQPGGRLSATPERLGFSTNGDDGRRHSGRGGASVRDRKRGVLGKRQRKRGLVLGRENRGKGRALGGGSDRKRGRVLEERPEEGRPSGRGRKKAGGPSRRVRKKRRRKEIHSAILCFVMTALETCELHRAFACWPASATQGHWRETRRREEGEGTCSFLFASRSYYCPEHWLLSQAAAVGSSLQLSSGPQNWIHHMPREVPTLGKSCLLFRGLGSGPRWQGCCWVCTYCP
uniref:uncharacterized protein LOC132695230 n=1 Tax=Panthera onca TaxID=9690 RepID=UPI0029548A28|nr:uncharacterized protein LOC132695230 [Panthera onca]